MITKVVVKDESTGKTNYDDLFRAAEIQLEYPANTINSIQDYLAALDLKGRDDINNYNLLRLPVEDDEPLFEIDANTREIHVPPVFKQNGLTVQGDKLAEIVYFKMARFFDMMDLFLFANNGARTTNQHNGAHCYIEWYNPTAKVGEHQRGVDYAYAMTCDEDYIYFGWPLADKVSGEAGTIQFSVRFLQIEDDEIIYNYATKIASCEIKTTLNFDFTDGSVTSDSWESILYTRPIYSYVINSTDSPAPILLQGIETEDRDMEVITQREVGTDPETGDPIYEPIDPPIYNLDIPVVATIASATAQGSQEITFKWYKNGARVTMEDNPTLITEGPAPAEFEDENAVQSVFHANSIGTYTVWIGNKISDKKNTRYIYTGTITIPGPEEVQIDESGIPSKAYLEENLVLRAGILNTVTAPNLLYTWYNDEGDIVKAQSSDSTFHPTEEGKYYCIVINTRNNEETDITDASRSLLADIRQHPQKLTQLELIYKDDTYFEAQATHDNNHKIEYVWYRRYIDTTTGMRNTERVFTDLHAGIKSEFRPTLPGLYYVEAVEETFDDFAPLYEKGGLSMTVTSNSIELDANLAVVPGDTVVGEG